MLVTTAQSVTTRARVAGTDLDAARTRCGELSRLSVPGVARVTAAAVELFDDGQAGEVQVTVALPAGTTALLAHPDEERDDAAGLRILGQVALAVAGLQTRAMAVGPLDLDAIRVRADGDALLVGLAAAAAGPADQEADGRALIGLLDVLGQPATPRTRQVTDLLTRRPLPDAAEIGRTALAAAVADPQRLATAALMRPRPAPATESNGSTAPTAAHAAESERRDTERVRVRNRMLGLGVLVVLVGLVLLKTLSGSSSRIDVPATAGRTEPQAVASLHRVGLQAREIVVTSTAPTGTVLSSSPATGQRLRAGATVTLRVSGGTHPGAAAGGGSSD